MELSREYNIFVRKIISKRSYGKSERKRQRETHTHTHREDLISLDIYVLISNIGTTREVLQALFPRPRLLKLEDFHRISSRKIVYHRMVQFSHLEQDR